MSFTVEQMLEVQGLENCLVLAGRRGLARRVTRVNVVDVPDIDSWVRGGEFLITTAFFAREQPAELVDLVRKIDRAGAAALGIKLKRFIDEVPEELLLLAEELSFPIIELPADLAFVDIINNVLSQIVNSQAQRLVLSERIHRAFTRLVIEGGDTQEIVETLGRTMKEEVVYLDTRFEQLYTGRQTDSFYDYSHCSSPVYLRSVYHEPVSIDNTVQGYILLPQRIPDENLPEHVRLAIEHAVTVLALDLQKRISNRQIEGRYKDMFVQDLIFNNLRSYEEVQKRAGFYGWDLSSGMLALIADIDNFKVRYLEIGDKHYSNSLEATARKIYSTARRIINSYFPEVFYTTFSDSIVFLLKCPSVTPEEFVRQACKAGDQVRQEITSTMDFTLTVGIGSYKSSVMDLHQSFSEAKEAVRLGRILYRQDRTLLYEALGVYRLLATVYKTPEAGDFYSRNLLALEEYDRIHSTDLCHTLEVIVQHDWNLRSAAEELYLHYNTIKYRYGRICGVLKLGPEDADHKLRIALALRLKQMMH